MPCLIDVSWWYRSKFFRPFVPNFVATVLGVFLGTASALWLADRGERMQRQVEIDRRNRALDVVTTALTYNRDHFASAPAALSPNRGAPFELALDYSTWDVVKSEIIPSLKNPDLQRRLAFHFARAEAAVRLSERYLAHSSGVEAAMGGLEGSRDGLRSYLRKTLGELDKDAANLIEEIQQARSQR